MSDPAGLGRFQDKTHILPLRIYYEDTDLAGVVYHANYLRFMERGRSEFFRMAGVPLAGLEAARPTAWALHGINVVFHRPARLDDPVEVHTRVTTLTGARLAADQKIMSRGNLLVEAAVEACLVTLAGKLCRIPAAVRARIAPFLSET